MGAEEGKEAVTALFRFPHTPHLAWLGEGEPRYDKVLSPAEASELLAQDVVIEEKLDGANLGLSVSSEGRLQAQNRGNYLAEPYTGQFSRLRSWLPAQERRLQDALPPNLIAFGEWCAARHSLTYENLPDWWLVFDIYDRSERRFWSTKRRNQWAADLGISTIPLLKKGRLTISDLTRMLRGNKSAFATGPLEGLVLRAEGDDWLNARAKLVRADFTQSIESHWRSKALEWNKLK